MEILLVDGLGQSPARVNMATGRIKLNRQKWPFIPEGYKHYIFNHEKGHYLLQTNNEKKADEFAFNQLAGSYTGSLKDSIKSLTRILNFKNPEHSDRLKLQTIRALRYDYEVNGNQEAGKLLKNFLKENYMYDLDDEALDNLQIETGYEGSEADFLGLGKKAKARREEKKAVRQERRVLKNENKKAKIEKKKSGGGGWFDKVVGLGKDFIASKKGGGSEATTDEPISALPPTATQPNQEKLLGMPKQTAIFAIIAVVVIGVVIFVFLRKKR